MNVTTAKHETVIDSFKVELELFTEDGQPRSDCTVTSSDGKFTSSLSRLQNEGTLYDANWRNEVPVDETTIDRISEWAAERGY